MALEEGLVLGHVLDAQRPEPRFEFVDPVHEEEGVTVRDELPDLCRAERRLHASTSPTVAPVTSLLLKSRSILVSVPSSPASKISPTPNSSNRSTTATHRTGESIWFRNASLTPSVVVNTAPSVAPIIGMTGSSNSTVPSSASISLAACSMSGDWN